MKIIQQRNVERVKCRERAFKWRTSKDPFHGFGFECDERGHIDTVALNPAARDNLIKCLNGTHDVIDLGVREYESKSVQPKIGLCKCNRKVYLEGFTNTCACGRDYNMSGQELAPRQFWGEETGEHPCDIANFNPDTYNDEEW